MDITGDVPPPRGEPPRGGAGAPLPSHMTIGTSAHRADEVARRAMPATPSSWPSWSSLTTACSQIFTSGTTRALALFSARAPASSPSPVLRVKIPTFEEYCDAGSSDRDVCALYDPDIIRPPLPLDARITRLQPLLREEFPRIYHEQPPRVRGYCLDSEYPRLFRGLDLLNTDPSSRIETATLASDSSILPATRVPKLLNFIWMGGHIPSKFRANLAHYADVMKSQGGEVVLWTDQTEVDEETRAFLSEHQIRLVPISSVFSDRSSMSLFEPFQSAYHRVPPNYGEASDLLRYEILDRFGGYYLDCDIEPSEFNLVKIMKKGEEAHYGFLCAYKVPHPEIFISADSFYETRLLPENNDNFGAVPRSRFTRNLKEEASRRYEVSAKEINVGERQEIIEETLYRSGPFCFARVVSKTIAEENLAHPEIAERVKDRHVEGAFYSLKETSSAFSWGNSALNPRRLQFHSDAQRIERIQYSVLHSLIYDGESLNLEIYRPYLKEGEEALLIDFVERTLEAHPELFSKVNRIFIKDLDLLVRLKTKIEAKFGHIEWNEKAMLKFACMVGSDSLIDYFIDTQHVDPFTAEEESRVPGYDCSSDTPISILIERKNIRVIEKLLLDSDHEKWTNQSTRLCYINYQSAGCTMKDLPKNLAIFYRELQKKHPAGTEEYLKLEAEARAYDALQAVIDGKLRRIES